MAEINATFVVDAIDLTVVQEDPGITFTPDPINLNVYAAGYAPPGGEVFTLQFNDNGKLGGAPNTAVSNGNISFGNVGNVKITGGTNGYFLQTDGSGNLIWAQGTANVSGNGTADGANTLIQISDGTGNFTSGAGFTFDNASNTFTAPGDAVITGNINGITVANGNINAVNVTASGVFTGDGSGLSNITVIGIANGTSNLAIPVADANVIISVGGQPNRFVVSTVGANVEGNLGVTGNVDANSINANTANITGNLTANNISVLEYANVKYLVANVSAEVAGLTVNSSSIKLGTGSNVGATTVAIGLAAGNANIGSNAIAIGARAGNSDQANNSIILNATGANLTTSTANSFTVKPVRNDSTANILFYNDTTGEITYDSAPATNEISNGTSNVVITSANGNVSFNINAIPNVTVMTAGGIETDTVNASYVVGNGYQMTGIEYSNIANTPTLGNIASINLNGNASQYLNGNGAWTAVNPPFYNVANQYVKIGNGVSTNGNLSQTAIGWNANCASASGTALGASTKADQLGVAVGVQANASGTTTRTGTVAIGALSSASHNYSIAIGYDAIASDQNGIAIGEVANADHARSIVINGSGNPLTSDGTDRLFVKPVRDVLGGGLPAGFKQVAYNPTTGEFIYYD